MISLRRKIDESEHFSAGYRALARVFLSLTSSLPKAALPANPDFAAECKDQLNEATAPLKGSPSIPEIDAVGVSVQQQFDEICLCNRTALEERDAAIKDVVAAVSSAINSLRTRGERQGSTLATLANNFETLTRIQDVNELRRQLVEQVDRLRQSVEEMRRESDEPARRLESQINAFQQRIEAARKGAGIDRLTGVGSRREAEKQMQLSLKLERTDCILLFDIEDFHGINDRYGTVFGDKLLQALAHLLRGRFPEDDMLFRWGADEFLVIVPGPLATRAEHCHDICREFGGTRYTSFDGGHKMSISAAVSAGAAECRRGETVEDLYRRGRQNLEQNRVGLRR